MVLYIQVSMQICMLCVCTQTHICTHTPRMKFTAASSPHLGFWCTSQCPTAYQGIFWLMSKLGLLSYGNKDQLLNSPVQLNTSASQREY